MLKISTPFAVTRFVFEAVPFKIRVILHNYSRLTSVLAPMALPALSLAMKLDPNDVR